MSRRLDAGASNGEDTKPFLDHLEDLRGAILACLISVGVGMVVAFPFTPQILDWLTAPLYRIPGIPYPFLRSLRVGGAFSVILRVGAWSGLLVATPFIVYFIARFVLPGLTAREKSVLGRASGFALGLFGFGVLLGYKVCLPIALEMMLGFHDWIDVAPEWTVNDYAAFTIQMLIGFGLAFQLPVIVMVLGKLGIITSAQLRGKRRHVIVICLLIGMVMTPQDVTSQIVMAGPLYILFEICIWLLWFDDRRARGGPPPADPTPSDRP